MVDNKKADELFARNVASFETMRAEIPNDFSLYQEVEKIPSKDAEVEPKKAEEGKLEDEIDNKDEDKLEKHIENELIENKFQENYEESINVKSELIKKHKNFTTADSMKAHERLIKSKE